MNRSTQRNPAERSKSGAKFHLSDVSVRQFSHGTEVVLQSGEGHVT